MTNSALPVQCASPWPSKPFLSQYFRTAMATVIFYHFLSNANTIKHKSQISKGILHIWLAVLCFHVRPGDVFEHYAINVLLLGRS